MGNNCDRQSQNATQADSLRFDEIDAMIHQFANELEHTTSLMSQDRLYLLDEPLTMSIEDNSLVFKNATNPNQTVFDYQLETFQCIAK